MPNYQAVSQAAHARWHWRRSTGYAFAAGDVVASLAAQEAPTAAMSLPLAFVPEADSFALVLLQGLAPGRNLLVAPDGRWRAAYIPAVYRGYPFHLGSLDGEQTVLCVDADSGLLVEADAGAQGALAGEAFFSGDQPSAAVLEVIKFMQALAAQQPRTARLCAQLQALELLEPWPITLQTEQGDQSVQGLYRVSEARLNALDEQALKQLQASGALLLAYCQLLSMQHLARLGELARQQLLADQAGTGVAQGLLTNAKGELDLEFLHQGGTLSFGGL